MPYAAYPDRVILHLDMDAFFAAVEVHDDPSLAGKPVIIGDKPRGVVSTASYEARRFGVRSGMPVATARKLCPNGTYLPGRRSRYAEVSHAIMRVLEGFSPLVEQASVDEAYIDASGLHRLYGPLDALCGRIKTEVFTAVGLTASIGAARAKFIAKIASDFQKPDGLTIIPDDRVEAFLHDLPLEKIPGVGGKAVAAFERLGLFTAGQVRELSLEFLTNRFGKWGAWLHERVRGIDERPVSTVYDAQSEGAEHTFGEDVDDQAVLEARLLAQAERVGRGLRRMDKKARTVTLKLRFADFSTITRARTLDAPTDADLTLFDTARAILAAQRLPQKIRLIGLTASKFDALDPWLPLFPDEESRRRGRVDRALDSVRDRFGKSALVRGRTEKSKPCA